MTNLPQHSTNSLLQSQKPNLLHFVQTQEEMKIVNAIESSFQIKTLKDLNPLLSIVAKWKLYLGVSEKISIEESSIQLSLIRDFIYENFGHLTLLEVELAYTLAATNKLENCEYYGFFSPFYVGKVLDSYMYYRKREMAELIRRKEKWNFTQIKVVKMSPEEECLLTRQIFEDFYKEFITENKINDVLNLCWNYLRDQVKKGNRDFFSKWTNPQTEEIEEAKKYAHKQAAEKENIFVDYYKTLNKSEEKQANKENELKKYMRNYCVQKFFETTEIDFILKSIKAEHFS